MGEAHVSGQPKKQVSVLPSEESRAQIYDYRSWNINELCYFSNKIHSLRGVFSLSYHGYTYWGILQLL